MSKAVVEHLKETGLHQKGRAMKVDPKELAMGIKIEMEHTSSKDVAREIALDHLHEDSKYYTHLGKMEEKHVNKSLMEGDMNLTKGKLGIRGVPDGSGPEGKGATGRQLGGCPQREGFKSDEEYEKAFSRWQKANKVEKSRMEGKMNGRNNSEITLVLIPGELTKAAKLSSLGSKHPAKLSGVSGKTKSKIPYTSHTERMKLAKLAGDRMLGKGATPSEDESAHTSTSTVDRKGRVAGEKAPYSGYGTGVSGMGSQAHGNFGKQTIIVKPSEIGSSAPEATTKHTPVKTIRKPRS